MNATWSLAAGIFDRKQLEKIKFNFQRKVFHEERPGHRGDGNYNCKTRKGRIQIHSEISDRIYNHHIQL